MAITDLLSPITSSSSARPVIDTLAAPGKALAAPSLNLTLGTNWPNSSVVYITIYNTTTVQLGSGTKTVKDDTSQAEYKGTLSGTTVSNLTLTGGSDRAYSAGAYVELAPTSRWAYDLYQHLTAHSNLDGSLKTAAVQSALNLGSTNLNGWNPLGYTFSSVTYNGNRSYTGVISGQDVTGTLSAGMRLLGVRTTAAPTQCTSLNGTNQYWSKTSPAGMTFTNNFVVSAWVKLSSYSTGVIASRFDGTSGWQLFLNSSGQVNLFGYNGGVGNASAINSYQSIPLNKWVHIAAQLDMATFTATPTTSYVMVDGVDVSAVVSRVGTNPTALVQAGSLQVGAGNSTAFFPGKIAQAFVSSAKITQANVQTLYSQGLTSALITANSIISAYSFDGNANDLNTTNANNLTANGAVTATNADSFSGNQADGTISSTKDYGIVQKVSFSTNSSITFQVPEGNTWPTSGTIASVSYSTQKAPYGMPVQRAKWIVGTTYRTQVTSASMATSVWTQHIAALIIPIGEWVYGFRGGYQFNGGGASAMSGHVELAPSTPANGVYDDLATSWLFSSNTQFLGGLVHGQSEASLSSATTYSVYGTYDQGTATVTGLIRGDLNIFTVYAENALL